MLYMGLVGRGEEQELGGRDGKGKSRMGQSEQKEQLKGAKRVRDEEDLAEGSGFREPNTWIWERGFPAGFDPTLPTAILNPTLLSAILNPIFALSHPQDLSGSLLRQLRNFMLIQLFCQIPAGFSTFPRDSPVSFGKGLEIPRGEPVAFCFQMVK